MRKYFAAILVTFIVSGCLNYEQITTVRGNKSGKMFVHYWTSRGALADTLFSGIIPVFNDSTIADEFSSPHVTISNIEIYKDNSDTTWHAKIDLEFDNIDSLVTTKAFQNSKISIRQLPDGNKAFNQFIQPFIVGFGFNQSDFSFKVVYYLPGKIIKHNASQLSGHKLTWQYSLDEIGGGKTLSAIFEPYPLEETPAVIYYFAGFVFVILFFYLFRKRNG